MKFDSYHPIINLIYFVSAIALTLCFNNPIFIGISYVCAFAYSVKLNGIKALIFNLCLVPFIVLYAFWYAYYNHFGITNLKQNFIGNEITLEALCYGFSISVRAGAVIMFMSCVFAIFSADKVVYLFGRISPKLSLFLSILLRAVPRIKKYGGKINIAQEGIGRGTNQGNILRRFVNCLRLISALITWSLENFIESAQSMKCRGYSLKGRTAFSIYRFDNRDRSFVVSIFLLLTLVGVGWLLNQTDMYYDPQLIINKITAVSYIFYISYAILLLLPMILQISGERKYDKLVAKKL